MVYHFVNFTNFPQTIAAAGTDYIVPPGGGSSMTSIVLQPGETIDICAPGGNWDIVGGSASLRFSAMFGGTLATSGYQRLPGGLILQWGLSAPTAAGLAVTFPVAFPNNCFAITTGYNGGANYPLWTNVPPFSKTGFTFYCSGTGTGSWFAIGN